MECESEKKALFFFRYGMNLPAEIRYKSPVQPKRLGKAGIFSGTKLPCFCTGIGTGTINYGINYLASNKCQHTPFDKNIFFQ